MNFLLLDDLLYQTLTEDIAGGDVTTLSCVPEDRYAQGCLWARAPGVMFGLSVFARVFALLDDTVVFTPEVVDGEVVENGTLLGRIEGPARSLLTGERSALNLLQRLSGVATATRKATDAVSHTKARIVDTRKTTPLWRTLEKAAVRAGGGSNHRINLSDGVLIKDNHIVAAGGIAAAVEAARKNVPHTLKIEVETTNLEEVRTALDAGADIIMLDNMDLQTMREAVLLIGGRALTEASGNMGKANLAQVAETGVDLISIGALTHSAPALDISLRFA